MTICLPSHFFDALGVTCCQAVKIEPNNVGFRFARRGHHDRRAQSTISC